MTPRPGRSGRWLLVAVLALLAGCRGLTRPNMDEALQERASLKTSSDFLADSYLVRCPDVLEVRVAGRPDWSGRFAVRPTGRVDLGPEGVRVEGRTAAQAAELVAAAAGLPREAVRAGVVEYKSQQVYLFGEVKGQSRAVPYQGPETVLELLRRVGGLTSGADFADVQVVRAHVADGRQPEVLAVDLRVALNKNDLQSNPRVQPFDQIHVGQSRPSSMLNCLPPWLRPVYRRLAGLSRSDHPAQWPGLLPRGPVPPAGGGEPRP